MDHELGAPRARLNITHNARSETALATTDGRWTFVSTSLSLLVAGAITWMAVGTLPVSRPMVGAPTHTPVAYELFMKLVQAGGANRLAALIPQRGPAPTGDEDQANPAPGIETRTVTLDRGDTLAGAMEDVGVSPNDANAAIAAMGKDFNSHALKAGMTFDLTYSLAPVIDATGLAPKPKTEIGRAHV